MSEFGILAVKIEKIDIYKWLADITKENDVQKWVKETIRDRWQKTGMDAFGNKPQTDNAGSGAYSSLTNVLKRKFGAGIGKITSYVTFTQSGDFWESLKLIITAHGFSVTGDFQKSGGHMYDNFTEYYANKKEFDNAVLGMSISQLNHMVNEYYFPRIEKKLNAIL